jgi:hypothetical protein
MEVGPRWRSERRRVERCGDAGPESSDSAGHPLLAHNEAISATIVGSVTRRASPDSSGARVVVEQEVGERRFTFGPLDRGQPIGLTKIDCFHSPVSRGLRDFSHRRECS